VQPFLVTERLMLRTFTAGDLDAVIALDGDPEVMRYLGDGRSAAPDLVERETLPALMARDDRWPQLGAWAAVERATGAVVGWFALHPSDPARPDDAELGYRLLRSAWGRGYATEGSRALVDKAFTELGLERVHAETMAVNDRSRRVMAGVGLRHVRTFHLEWDDPIPGTGHGEVEYALTRAEWEQRRGATAS